MTWEADSMILIAWALKSDIQGSNPDPDTMGSWAHASPS